MRNKCNTCGGEYDTVLTDGSLYFHVCSPETLVTIERAGAPLEVPIADVRPDDLITVLRAGASAKVAAGAMQPDDVRIGERSRTRAEARNENIDPRAKPGARVAFAEGRGATQIRA
jgi:hypothetical protein